MTTIPYRDWVPDFKVPTVCEVDGCQRSVRRAFFTDGEVNGDGQPPIHIRQWIFCCPLHGDLLEHRFNAWPKNVSA